MKTPNTKPRSVEVMIGRSTGNGCQMVYVWEETPVKWAKDNEPRMRIDNGRLPAKWVKPAYWRYRDGIGSSIGSGVASRAL